VKAVAALAALASAPASAEVVTVRYLCERGVAVPVTYVSAEGAESVAVLNVEGGQITLIQEISGSGARYGWPSGGSHYVWWSKGDAATLLWRDGETTIEEPVYEDCRVRE
jgi:membrane-bound inhibitor of C-type lysozyme